ncbi:dipicolinate synthase subunit DpsA [Desulfosporosinus fructosivorans]|uniref:Dipicolinate synthase subunit DpsA n=1 Tax=Desulfosporosinus fructosivorans TaxID=2018669 RepID=A0A4Z0R814_9FIRM|nr:dipicolinate synthase subunit DpsA [Desulfosporosinus fructosivorans]TGE39311.1 dipicolinate synthase subunit DpsA [Desulfosporosinus fructosivorans]
MTTVLNGIRLGVVGGDDRELYLISELQKQGASIVGVGFEKAPPIPGMVRKSNIQDIVAEVDALLFPMFGTDDRGGVKAKYSDSSITLNKEVLQVIPQHVPIFIGWARPALKSAAKKMGIRLIETAKLDEIAILNSIPSAEGAIHMAIKETPITIHQSESFVLGLGRTGWSIARMLKGMGASVTGVARRPDVLARAVEMGLRAVHFEDLEEEIRRAEIIFNTVPTLILDRPILDRVSRDAVIIDLASIPGGTDFEYADMLGIKALLAPGLPGLVAPKTAGKILAEVYKKLILLNLMSYEHRI